MKKIDPIEGILAILDQGDMTATSKLALLLAIIDLAPIAKNNSLSFNDLAKKIFEIHWHQSSGYSNGVVLKQIKNGNNDTNIVPINSILIFKNKNFIKDATPPHRIYTEYEKDIKPLLKIIKSNMIKYPLKRLQTIGLSYNFLYEIEENNQQIVFNDNVLNEIIKFSSVLKTLVEIKYVEFVVDSNKQILGETAKLNKSIYNYLFGLDREMPPIEMKKELLKIQGEKCIYTNAKIYLSDNSSEKLASIDHFIPWSITRLSMAENFILTSKSFNSKKSNYLLGGLYLEKYVNFMANNYHNIHNISNTYNWQTDISSLVSTTKKIYKETSSTTLFITNGKKNGIKILSELEKNKCIYLIKELEDKINGK